MSTVSTTFTDPAALKSRIDRFQEAQRSIVREVRKVIVGQEEVIEQVLISLFVGGHCLITGLPGTAKTLLVRTLAQTLGLVFKRIQFTPDLDVRAGTDLFECSARRRDQPHAAEDAIGAARSDAGAFLHSARPSVSNRGAVLRTRDAEPDRTRRHVSTAGSAARSVSV